MLREAPIVARATPSHRRITAAYFVLPQSHRRSIAFRQRIHAGMKAGGDAGGTGKENGRKNEPLRPPWFQNSQARSGFSQYSCESLDVRQEHAASQCLQPVIAPSRIAPSRAAGSFFHQALADKFFQIVIQRAWSDFVLSRGLPGDLLHDAVPVQILSGERQQNVQRRGREREKWLDPLFHTRNPIYRIPSIVSSVDCGRRKLVRKAKSTDLKIGPSASQWLAGCAVGGR